MNKTEIKLLNIFIEDYLSRLNCDGCNDFTLQNTKENRDLVKRINKTFSKMSYSIGNSYEDYEINLPTEDSNNLIYTMNTKVLRYLKDKLLKELGNE